MKMQRGNTLVATMAVLVIMLILAVALFKGTSMFGVKAGGPGAPPARADGKGTTVMGAAEMAARDEVCRSNLGQLRQALEIASQSDPDGHYPASLDATHLGRDFYSCPVGHEPYVYDPTTGKVHCVHPGHENY